MVKLILQPYLFCLIVSIGILFWIVIKYRELISTKIIRLIWISIILLISIIILSVPLVSTLIEKSLYVKSSIHYSEPDVIAILGGGYFVNTLEELDVLIPETMNRVEEGIMWWKNNPTAILVMCGKENIKGRLASRGAFLMKKQAEIKGVPSNKIFLDTLSINTWDHPKKLTELSNIDTNMVVGIVTSKWHMRRALWSFKRYFNKIQVSTITSYPFIDPISDIYTFRKFYPNSLTIAKTTLMIHEWIGLLWYNLKALVL